MEYPPKNRQTRCLPVLQIEIVHACGVEIFDPNGLAILAYSNPHRFLDMPPLDNRKSVLSKKPAVLYRADDLEIPLTPEELYAFVCCNLSPDQMFTLRSHFGAFYEIHEDFYDSESGEALQPLHRR